jgi:hypothetical protein
MTIPRRAWRTAAGIGGVLALAGTVIALTPFGSTGPGSDRAADESGRATCAGPSPTVSGKRCAPNSTTTTTAAPVPVATTINPTAGSRTTIPARPNVPTSERPSARCPQFLEERRAAQAFCDTLGTPDPTPGTRSGALNGVLWGVDRYGGPDNDSQHLDDNWAKVEEDRCGTDVEVSNLNDIDICDGHLVEAQDDQGGQDVLSMYPRQPFNFASGTQDVEFNVSDNSGGSHSSWPDFAITNVPVPAPDGSPIYDGNLDPPDSVGVDLTGSARPDCVSATIWETRNYQKRVPAQTRPGCAIQASSAKRTGQPMAGITNMNHVEIVISAKRMDVYMSDAGTLHMHLIDAADFTLPLTQGLVWLEDEHYNGSKFCSTGGGCQQHNTYAWSDLAFSGPVEPRDLGFDVLDNTVAGPPSTMGDAPTGLPTTNLGYPEPYPRQVVVSTRADNSPTAADIAKARGSLLTLCTSGYALATTLHYTVNGKSNTFNTAATKAPTLSGGEAPAVCLVVPVPLSEVRPGVNTLSLYEPITGLDNTIDFSNISLILQGAGGVVRP